ncbi:MAG: proline--tRNA ligase [Nanoarchaeota archaeon]|nr:proline--tRNA ligase [Nanoarchaeota archaeon]
MEQTQGITVKKSEDFSEWYSQVVQKAELADYSSVSGCMVLRPTAYAIWEKIKAVFDQKIKASGHTNAYFPLFIPEHLFKKEQEHVEGFSPEVAWVTQAGDTKLKERLAIRPTSETIIYESYSKWIRSHRDLPMLLNQWCNIVRWEFKYPKPFLRTREFLWQEGHTAHATREEAEKEAGMIMKEYIDLVESYLAIPIITGRKTEKEKFAGAEYTLTFESMMPDGKAVQMGTSHMLGQNFSKAFGIEFLDQDNKKKHVWQTSWGISTRLIGAMIMTHADDQGLIIPPKVAPLQVAIVPIIFEKNRDKTLKEAESMKNKLEKHFTCFLDDRDYTAGWKFNDHELKGVPIRVELGPRDIEKKQAVVVRRDTRKKEFVKQADLITHIKKELEAMQKSLYAKAKKTLKESITSAKTMAELKKAIKEGKLVKVSFCGTIEEEDMIKEDTGGASSRTVIDEKPGKCVHCGKQGKLVAYFAKAY